MKEQLTPIVNDINNWHDLELNELCTVFPAMNEEDYNSLVSSMNEQGFLPTDPVILIDVTPDAPEQTWEILDGRNRHLAAMDSGNTPDFMEYTGDNPLGFVTSRNLDRRHLTTGQKAAVAAALADLTNGQNTTAGSTTQSEAAEKVGVGEASLRRYKFIEKHDPALAEEVKKGNVPLEKARAAVKKELEQENKEAMQATTNPIDQAEPQSLGDKRAERKRQEREAISLALNDIVITIMEKYKLDGKAPATFIAEAVAEGYKLGKGEEFGK